MIPILCLFSNISRRSKLRTTTAWNDGFFFLSWQHASYTIRPHQWRTETAFHNDTRKRGDACLIASAEYQVSLSEQFSKNSPISVPKITEDFFFFFTFLVLWFFYISPVWVVCRGMPRIPKRSDRGLAHYLHSALCTRHTENRRLAACVFCWTMPNTLRKKRV